MPELPEVEITARLLSAALRGAEVEKAIAKGVSTLKTFHPPVESLSSKRITDVSRRGKLLVVNLGEDASIVIHLMSAGRLQLFDTHASLKDKTLRFALRLAGGRELRLREFGTRQAAWVKLVRTTDLDDEEPLRTLGPDAWPVPPKIRQIFTEPRPLHSALRYQRLIAGIGRSWADEILHAACLSPFSRANSLSDEEGDALQESIGSELSRGIAHYEKVLRIPIPDKYPIPLRIHAHEKQPCPRCGDSIEAVSFESYSMCYCPTCQTAGKLLKDRRMSRLLK